MAALIGSYGHCYSKEEDLTIKLRPGAWKINNISRKMTINMWKLKKYKGKHKQAEWI